MPLPRVTIRSFSWPDLPPLVAVMNRALAVDGETSFITERDLRHFFSAPGRTPDYDCLIALVGGEIAGFCYVFFEADGAQAWLNGDVDPAFRNQGIGTRLLRAGEARVRQGPNHDDPALRDPFVVSLYVTARSTLASKIDLLTAEGYRPVRTALIMRGALSDPTPIPMPQGIRLRSFDPTRDTYAVYTVDQAAFRGQFGRAPDPFESWQHEKMSGPRYDPALWSVAEDTASGQIVGAALCRAYGEDHPLTGWVDAIGVLPGWRKRGIGRALLWRSFGLFWARGWTPAELGVDSQNDTGAIQIYERAGMTVIRRDMVYHKAITVGGPPP